MALHLKSILNLLRRQQINTAPAIYANKHMDVIKRTTQGTKEETREAGTKISDNSVTVSRIGGFMLQFERSRWG